MLIRVTEEEAFTLACAANGAQPTSHWAERLREAQDLGGIFYDFERDGDSRAPGFVAVCAYFAVRGGAVVMREETWAERSERMDDQAAAVWG